MVALVRTVLLFVLCAGTAACARTGFSPFLTQGDAAPGDSIGAGAAGGDTTPNPVGDLQITVDSQASSSRAGWLVRMEGSCAPVGASVVVSSSSSSVTAQSACSAQGWRVHLDTSDLSVGSHVLQVEITVAQGGTARTTWAANKVTDRCDLMANRIADSVAGFAGGAGDRAAPHIICTPMQLDAMRLLPNKHYELHNDIYFNHSDSNGDLVTNAADANYSTGQGWQPLVDFAGSLHGFFFTVRDLYVDRDALVGVGLIGAASAQRQGLYVYNLNFRDATVIGLAHVGVLIGTASYHGMSVRAVHVRGEINVRGGARVGGIVGDGIAVQLRDVSISGTGSIRGTNIVGGIAGASEDISMASSDIPVIGTGDCTGGTVGESRGTLDSCSVTGPVQGVTWVGGIIGCMYVTVAHNLRVSAAVQGDTQVGGIVGSFDSSLLRDSYSSGSVTGVADVGGIAGYARAADMVGSFSLSSVQGDSATMLVGPVVGNWTPPEPVAAHYLDAQCTNAHVSGCNTTGVAHPDVTSFYGTQDAPVSTWTRASITSAGPEQSWSMTSSAPPLLFFEGPDSYMAPFVGDGTALSPYLLVTADDLRAIGSNIRLLDSHFLLTQDIDLGGLALPPLARSSGFAGVFDGNGKTLTGLSVALPADTSGINAGLFGSLATTGRVFDLTLANVDVRGTWRTGALAGSSRGQISDVRIIGGVVLGFVMSGGLVGRATGSGIIERCDVGVDVIGVDYVGGFTGVLSGTDVRQSSASGEVLGQQHVGGFMGGYGFHSQVSGCSSHGLVTATTGSAGGFAGESSAYIYDCYATGDVVGVDGVGGFIGENINIGQIYRSYSTGSVTGFGFISVAVGGFIGRASANRFIVDSFCVGNVRAVVDAGPTLGPFLGEGDPTLVTGSYYTDELAVVVVNDGTGGVNTFATPVPAMANWQDSVTTPPLDLWDFSSTWVRTAGDFPKHP